MSYIEKMCLVNWRFRSFVRYIFYLVSVAEQAVGAILGLKSRRQVFLCSANIQIPLKEKKLSVQQVLIIDDVHFRIGV